MNKELQRLSRFKDLENLMKVLKYALDNSVGLGVNLQVLTSFYLEHLHHKRDYSKREFYTAYMRLYRFFTALESMGYVDIAKHTGLVWVKPRLNAVDLILYARKTQTQLKDQGDRVKPLDHLIYSTRKRLHEDKFTARNYLSVKKLLSRDDYEYLHDLFLSYVDDVERKVLVFKSPEGEIVVKRYTHRFQKRYLRRLKDKFRKIFDNASKRFQYGVFVTLTMDPKTYDSLLEGIKKRSRAWNRFMSFLSKRVGFRPSYIGVLEFQDSGNPHLHVVIFGINRIMNHYELTEYLKNHGFGQIHYEYKIVNKHGNWVWANPKNAPSRFNISVVDYLEKYLEKAFGIPEGVKYKSSRAGSSPGAVAPEASNTTSNLDVYKVTLYWASDARFFTYSRTLYQTVHLPREYGWVFIGSYNVFEAPDWLWDYIEDLIHVLGPPPWV